MTPYSQYYTTVFEGSIWCLLELDEVFNIFPRNIILLLYSCNTSLQIVMMTKHIKLIKFCTFWG